LLVLLPHLVVLLSSSVLDLEVSSTVGMNLELLPLDPAKVVLVATARLDAKVMLMQSVQVMLMQSVQVRVQAKARPHHHQHRLNQQEDLLHPNPHLEMLLLTVLLKERYRAYPHPVPVEVVAELLIALPFEEPLKFRAIFLSLREVVVV
jgi:hypothetical protein